MSHPNSYDLRDILDQNFDSIEVCPFCQNEWSTTQASCCGEVKYFTIWRDADGNQVNIEEFFERQLA